MLNWNNAPRLGKLALWIEPFNQNALFQHRVVSLWLNLIFAISFWVHYLCYAKICVWHRLIVEYLLINLGFDELIKTLHQGHLDSWVVFTLNFWTSVCYPLGHQVNPWWRLFFFGSSKTSMLNFQRWQRKRSRKQLLTLLIVKKLLKFVLFMKMCWKSQKWRIIFF